MEILLTWRIYPDPCRRHALHCSETCRFARRRSVRMACPPPAQRQDRDDTSHRTGIAAGERRATAAAELTPGRHRTLGDLRARVRAHARYVARARGRAPGPAPARARAATGHIAGTGVAPDLIATAGCPRTLDLARRRVAADDVVRTRIITANHTARDVRWAHHVGRVTAATCAAIDRTNSCGIARALRATELAQRGVRRDRLACIGDEPIVAAPTSRHGAPAIATALTARAVVGRGTLYRTVSNARVVAPTSSREMGDHHTRE